MLRVTDWVLLPHRRIDLLHHSAAQSRRSRLPVLLRELTSRSWMEQWATYWGVPRLVLQISAHWQVCAWDLETDEVVVRILFSRSSLITSESREVAQERAPS